MRYGRSSAGPRQRTTQISPPIGHIDGHNALDPVRAPPNLIQYIYLWTRIVDVPERVVSSAEIETWLKTPTWCELSLRDGCDLRYDCR
jgi:hypothetical protein